ncbi:MAG: glycosyltransferase [Proteobacteria bacterium]|nr:glycosyltransferase [Pseudomonadota bacterium]
MSTPVLGGALEGTRGELIVYFASHALDGPAGTDRHMAEALGVYGPVLYADPPMSALARFRKRTPAGSATPPRLEVINPRLARLTNHVVPGLTRPLLHYLVGPMVMRATRAAVYRLYGPAPRGDPRVAAVVSSRVDALWSALPARRTLFYATDDLPSGAALLGVPRERLLRAESRTLRGADAVAVVSQALQERYAQAGFFAELVPNGCDPDAYESVDTAPRPSDCDLPGPVAGFVGHINDRIDLALLEAVAGTGCSLLLVGPVVANYRSAARFAELARQPNVRCVGPKPFSELRNYLRVIDVGLTPYANTEFNRASFPLKTLEYLAAGRAVVATPLPANEWLATDLIEVAASPVDYAARVLAALAKPRTPELAARRRSFASQHSWRRRAATIAKLLGLDAIAPLCEQRRA